LSLASDWLVVVGVASILVLLAIFSMLVMAHWQEEDQDRLEIELLQRSGFPSHNGPEKT